MLTVIPNAGDIMVAREFDTCLTILRGDFEAVSMAIYGDVVSDTSPEPTTYSSLTIPTHSSVPLVSALDAVMSNNLTALARNLLELLPDLHSLSLVIRLIFCLKQPRGCPHLYSDLREEEMEMDLDTAFRCLSRPIADDISSEQLYRFAKKVSEAARQKEVVFFKRLSV
ncbi:hypothetical protein M405DRAFT_828989 [Rhizopogon salebrosus TDB-379]|nr:hypothetical protein M405DRAFT_828989 [Rhizopogon salebrosus TDB-379]